MSWSIIFALLFTFVKKMTQLDDRLSNSFCGILNIFVFSSPAPRFGRGNISKIEAVLCTSSLYTYFNDPEPVDIGTIIKFGTALKQLLFNGLQLASFKIILI